MMFDYRTRFQIRDYRDATLVAYIIEFWKSNQYYVNFGVKITKRIKDSITTVILIFNDMTIWTCKKSSIYEGFKLSTVIPIYK